MPLKIKLDLDALSVESFATSVAEARRGTVHGHISETTCDLRACDCGTSAGAYCTDISCVTCDETCGYSCNGTCHENTCATCNESCGQYCTTGPVIVCSCSPTG